MMTAEQGEKIGWLAGWIGGFLWVAILSGVFLAKGRWPQGVLGIVLVAVAWASVMLLVPWKHPDTAYWKLMLAPYACLIAAVAWAFWSFDEPMTLAAGSGALLTLLPVLLPLALLGKRRWSDRLPRQR